jgi:hypothetical protein
MDRNAFYGAVQRTTTGMIPPRCSRRLRDLLALICNLPSWRSGLNRTRNSPRRNLMWKDQASGCPGVWMNLLQERIWGVPEISGERAPERLQRGSGGTSSRGRTRPSDFAASHAIYNSQSAQFNMPFLRSRNPEEELTQGRSAGAVLRRLSLDFSGLFAFPGATPSMASGLSALRDWRPGAAGECQSSEKSAV